MSTLDIGLIGLGAMGSGIANSISSSNILLSIYDVNKKRLNLNSQIPNLNKTSPEEIITKCDVVLFCVPSSKEINELLERYNPKIGSTIIDLTSSDPRVTAKRAKILFETRNVYQLDAAMSGGAKGAAAGKLTLMVGGDKKVLQMNMQLLSSFSERIFHIGDAGKGQLMKLFHNAVCHGNFLLLSEICIKGEQNGLNLEQMIEVFNCSNARSYISERRFPDHILSGTFDGKSTPSNLKKDLNLLNDLLQTNGEETYLSHSLRLLNKLDPLYENDDFMLIYPQLKELSDG